MFNLIVVLAVIVAILLAAIVLIQESKGGGLASSVAGANSVLGVRKTTDFVEKATWTLAGLLVVLSVSTTFFVNRNTNTADDLVGSMKKEAPAAEAAATVSESDGERVFISPRARKLALQTGVDMTKVVSTGPHGRIIERGNHNDLIAQKGKYYQLYTGAFELE